MFEKLLEFLKNLTPSQTITVAFGVMLGVILWSHEQDRQMWAGQITRIEARQAELAGEYRANVIAFEKEVKMLLEGMKEQQKLILDHLLKMPK